VAYLPNKKSARWFASRHEDNYTNLGYNYKGKIFRKSMSHILFQNKVNAALLDKIEPMIQYLIDCVKQVRIHYMFSLDKNDTRIR